MATIGRHAVTELASGGGSRPDRVEPGSAHLLYLMGFRNRVKVFVEWAWNYLTYDAGSRILRESELHAVEAEGP